MLIRIKDRQECDQKVKSFSEGFYVLKELSHKIDFKMLNGGFFWVFPFFMYDIQHCFICRPSDSTMSGDAGIEPGTVATTALAVRRSNHSAKSHPHSAKSHPPSAKSHPLSAKSHPPSAKSHPPSAKSHPLQNVRHGRDPTLIRDVARLMLDTEGTLP